MKRSVILKPLFMTTTMVGLGFAYPAFSDAPLSRISVPMSISLGGLEGYVNQRLPGTLHHREYGRTCVEPERACTKVPEFRGFKMTMKNRCVEITPRIDCTITEHVVRDGGLSVSGSGSSIVIRQTVSGSGTVRGRGEVGRHIRQTVRAQAELTVTAQPSINSDWTPRMPVSITYRWLQRPEFRLLNLFPVSLGSTLGPPLDRAISDFQRITLPAELARLDLRSEAEALWAALQEPMPLELAAGRRAYLHLQPQAVEFDGPGFDGGRLSARLSVALRAHVDEREYAKTRLRLPNLSAVPGSDLSLTVPVRLRIATLEAAVAERAPHVLTLDEASGASVSVDNVTLEIDGDALVAEFDIDPDARNLPVALSGTLGALVSGRLRASARPVLDVDAARIAFTDLEVSAIGGGLGGMARNLALSVATEIFGDDISFAFGERLATVETELNKRLNRDLTPELRLSGAGMLKIASLGLDETAGTFEAVVRSTGQLRVTGFDPVR